MDYMKEKKWLQEPSLAKCNNNNINAVVLYCKEQVLSLQLPIKEFWKKIITGNKQECEVITSKLDIIIYQQYGVCLS